MQEENSAVIIDADFLSSFLKIGKLALIKDFFRVEKLYIPVAVFSEIAKTKLVNHVLDEKYLQIENIGEKTFGNFDNLGNGEKECIALCKKFKKSLLLTSDKKALGVAKNHGIMVINIPAFLFSRLYHCLPGSGQPKYVTFFNVFASLVLGSCRSPNKPI